MKSDTKIGIFVVLLLVAVVVVLLGREVMNRKNKAGTEPSVAASAPAEGTDVPPVDESVQPETDRIKDDVVGAPEGPAVADATPAPGPATFVPSETPVQPNPPTVITEVPPPQESPAEYVVKSGDSLEKISKQVYGKRSLWKRLADANPGINERNLKVGARLVVPPAPASEVRTAEVAPVSGGRTYTVKSGDSLEKISKEVFGKRSLWKQIKDANPGLDERRLRVGMVIQLPEGPAAPAAEPRKSAKVDPWTQRGATRLVTAEGR